MKNLTTDDTITPGFAVSLLLATGPVCKVFANTEWRIKVGQLQEWTLRILQNRR